MQLVKLFSAPKRPLKIKDLIQVELFFLLFVSLNLLKLTGVQYFITWNSGFEIYKMLIKNSIFLYFCWRLLMLQPSRTYFTFFFILQDLYLLLVFLFYLYSGNILNLSQLRVIGEGVHAAITLTAVLREPKITIFLIDVPALFFLFKKYPKYRRSMQLLSIPFVILSGIALYLILQRMDYFRATGVEWGYIGQNAKFGTIYTSLVLGNPASETEAIKELQYGPEVSIPGKKKKYNAITIQVESLNSDIVDYEHKGEKVMPFLSSLRHGSIYYPRMVPQHRSGGSSDAEFALFNGIEALYSFPVCQFSRYEYPNSFLRQLNGYTKYAFHGNSGEYFNRNHNLPAMGFDTFFDIYDMQLPEEGWGASDRAVFDFVIDQTEIVETPFYYHIITMSSHGPFNLVGNYYQNELFDDVERRVEHDYLLSMNYVDQQLQYFIGKMQEMAPDTYFFIYSDHSVKLQGDHYQPNSRTVLDGNKIEFVPLLIIGPDDTSILMEEKAAAFLDLGLTVLEAAGVEARIRSFGDNLLKPEELNDTIVHFGKTISRKKLAELPLTPQQQF